MTDIPEVLFVCTHNAGRSQMAAGLLDHQAAGRVLVTLGWLAACLGAQSGWTGTCPTRPACRSSGYGRFATKYAGGSRRCWPS